MEFERLRKKVIEQYAPSEEEIQETNKKYTEISELINKEFGLETHFAGSASRETCMAGDKDIDIFVLFPEDTPRQELEDRGLEIGKTVFRKFNEEHTVEYAEHPYTKGEIDGHEVEIVPCYDVPATDIRSSVDRTPHHSRWVQENLSEEQRDDVVMLKVFLRAGELYGSSLKVQGFSGYLCEIMIAEHGSFQNLMHEVSNWKENQVIDPEDHHETLSKELKKKFSEDNLVVIDPVDPERNVASVMSDQTYAEFLYRCWEFRNKPGMHMFTEQEDEFSEFELQQELEKHADMLVIEFENIDEVDDIVYPQMRKTIGRLEQVLKTNDFRIYNQGFHVGEKTRIFFELDQQLPRVQEIKGPKVFHGEEHLAQFRSKYDNTYIKGTRLCAKTDREHSDAKKLLKEFLSSDLKENGIPGNVARNMGAYRFTEPQNDDTEWLKYLAEELHV